MSTMKQVLSFMWRRTLLGQLAQVIGKPKSDWDPLPVEPPAGWDGPWHAVVIDAAMPSPDDFPSGWKYPGHPTVAAAENYRFLSYILELNNPYDCNVRSSLVVVYAGENSEGESVYGWECIPDLPTGEPDRLRASDAIQAQAQEIRP